MPCPGPTFSGLALLLVGYHRIHSKISGRANELQKQSTFCFYQKSKPLASYASKQLLKTSLNHHQTAHFIFLRCFAFSAGEEISFRNANIALLLYNSLLPIYA